MGEAGDTSSGAPATGSGGERPSLGGAPSQGQAGEAAPSEQGGRGGEPSIAPEGEELSFCPRLVGLSKLSLAVEEAYIGAAIRDCRIAWLIPRRQELIDMRNELITWSRRFWGCDGLPVTTFPLVWGTPALSQGDADAAIETYLAAAKQELALSPIEEQEMLAALKRLSAPLVEDPSLEPSKPSCDPGGDGGAGGVASGGAGGGP